MSSNEYASYLYVASAAGEQLKETAFVQDREFDQHDVDTTRLFLVDAAAHANPRLFPNFWDTTLLASLYARRITETLQPPDITPDEAEALNLIHDIGRIASPDQFYRNDLLADAITRKAGFREEPLEKIPSLRRILGFSKNPIQGSDEFTAPQRVLHVADWLGKRSASGLVTVDEILTASDGSFSNYRKNARWPSTRAGLDALESGKAELGKTLFTDNLDWLEAQGIDFDSLREEIKDEADSAQNQQWVAAAIAAQLS